MARKYREVEQLVEIIQQRHDNGETYREIGASFGLTREEARGAVKRQRRKERKIVAGYMPRSKGHPRKGPADEYAKRNSEVAHLRMTV